MGVTVTFIAVLELMREGLIEIVQAEPFAPLHVRAAEENRMLRLVANNDLAPEAGESVFEGGDAPAPMTEQPMTDQPPVDEEPKGRS
jgi:hypothetical protein